MKFIHAADVHLGNPIKGIDRRIDLPKRIQKELALATFSALKIIVKKAINLHVDFILFPGDLFDSKQQNPYLYNFLTNEFLKLEKSSIQVYLSFGNHDFFASSQKNFIWPKNVHIFPKEENKVFFYNSLDNKRIAISGISYSERKQPQSLLKLYNSREKNIDFEIGLYHGAMGDIKNNNYAPFRFSDLQSLGYDYWALGHIHTPYILSKDPLCIYSGDPQGLNSNETGRRGVFLVSDDGNSHNLKSNFIPIGKFVFNIIEINLYKNLQLKVDNLVSIISKKIGKKNNNINLYTLNINLYFELNKEQKGQIRDPNFLALLNEQISTYNNFLVKIKLAPLSTRFLYNNLDKRYWVKAKEEIFNRKNIHKKVFRIFGNQQKFITDYFSKPEINKELVNKAEEIISERSKK